MLSSIELIAGTTFIGNATAESLALPLHVPVINGVGVTTADGLTSDVGPEPLGRVVVQEAFGMGKAHRHVAWVAGVLEHRFQGEGRGLGGPIVGGVLHGRWI